MPRGDTAISVKEKTDLKKPNLYCVLILNDDYTPMEFVVWVLQKVFHKPLEEATHLMLQVHTQGRGLCGVFTHDIAQTKVYQVKTLAEQHGHPLECVLEAE